MSRTKWYQKPVYLLVALTLALSLGLVALPMAGTVEAQPGVTYYVNATGGDDSRTAEEAKNPGTPWLTIQHAIGTVPDESTINVAAGTYNENVNVNKQVTINGAGAATTIVTAANSQDHVLEVTADGASITNLAATGANYPSYTYRDKSGIFAKKASGTISSVTISGVTASGNNIGIYLDHASGSTVTGCTATNNILRGIYLKWSDGNTISSNNASSNDVTGSWASTQSWAGIGIYLEYSCNNQLTGNTANSNKGGGSNSGIGIYLGKPGATDVCSVLTGNTANENACLSNMEMSGIGILLWQAGGTASDHTVLTGNTANANIYNGTGKEKSGSGIVHYQTHYADVTGNTVNGNQGNGYYSEGAIGNFVHDNVVTGNTATGNEYGFHLCNDRSNYSSNTITGNTDTGIYGRAYGGMSLTGTVLRANNISGNALFGASFTSWSVDDRLDAECNWWGHVTGPAHTSNPHGGSENAVSDNVDFMPWYATATTTPTTQYVSVDHAFASIIAYSDTIQGGIDAAVAGDTVNVAAGTYNETPQLKGTTASDISIIGENKATTFITGGICFAADYSGLKVQNFSITGNGFLDTETYEATVSCHWPGHYAVTNLEFSDCVFDGQGYDDGEGGRCGVVIKRLGGVIKFESCEFKNYRGWATLDVNDGSGGGALAVTSYTLSNNNVHDNWGSCALRGKSGERTDTVTVEGNTFDSNGNSASNSWAALEINEADSVTVSNNTINDTEAGSWGDGQALQFWNIVTIDIYGNHIINNAQGIYIFSDGVGGTWCGSYGCPVPDGSISFNNISGNADYGLKLDAAATGGPLDAENNWWGHASGPHHPTLNPDGSGNEVSDNVDFEPWLGAEVKEADTGTGADASAETANASAQATGGDETTTVAVAEYVGEPTGMDPGFAADGVFVDVHVSGTLPSQLAIEIACPGADCSGTVMRWFDGTAWQDVDPQVVTNGTVKATLNDVDSTPLISQLTGTPFAAGSPPVLPPPPPPPPSPPPPTPTPGAVGGTAYPPNKLAILAPWLALFAAMVAGTSVLLLRRRRAQI
jgi:parallel beta-helix repeat protein